MYRPHLRHLLQFTCHTLNHSLQPHTAHHPKHHGYHQFKNPGEPCIHFHLFTLPPASYHWRSASPDYSSNLHCTVRVLSFYTKGLLWKSSRLLSATCNPVTSSIAKLHSPTYGYPCEDYPVTATTTGDT